MKIFEFLQGSSDTLLGICFGAALAALPTVSMYIIELIRQKSQQKHELRMKRIDLLETPRLTALQDYSRIAGALIGNEIRDEFNVTNFRAAHQRAAMFVSPETYNAMSEAIPVILSGWEDNADMSPQEKMADKRIQALNHCLRTEMYLDSSAGNAKPANFCQNNSDRHLKKKEDPDLPGAAARSANKSSGKVARKANRKHSD